MILDNSDQTQIIDIENDFEDGKIKLAHPIDIGDGKKLEEVTILPVKTPALKGLSRAQLLLMDDETHKKLWPRVTNPPITPNMFNRMSAYDTTQIMTAINEYFTNPSIQT